MSRKQISYTASSLVIVAVVLWLWLRPAKEIDPNKTAGASPPTPNASPSVSLTTPQTTVALTQPGQATVRRNETVGKILSVLATPITFYGKVIDQNGGAVSNANVTYGTIDKFDADGSHFESKSDANGYFSISGIKGAVLTVGVWKDGYYSIDSKSDAAFAYGVGPDATRKEPPTRENPALFILQN